MKIYSNLKKVKSIKNAVVALGVFDGVHLGHEKILKAAVKKAHSVRGKSLIVTFYPHPQKEDSISSLSHRLKLISRFGIDSAIVISFTKNFSQITAEDFIKDILCKRIGAKYIFVGSNFTFGKSALGNVNLLKQFSKAFNYQLTIFKVVKYQNKIISSTYIRKLIRKGKLKEARILLDRPVTILGTVIKGSSIARKLGFPTANIDPHHEVTPPCGVYAVKVRLGKLILPGVCSIGHKPTFGFNKIRHIEVHLFNFKKSIYKRILEIEFIKYIRKQRKFANIENLAKRISLDIKQAKRILLSS